MVDIKLINCYLVEDYTCLEIVRWFSFDSSYFYQKFDECLKYYDKKLVIHFLNEGGVYLYRWSWMKLY